MALPNLLATSTTIGPPRRRAVSPVAGQVASLGLQMEHQQHDNWCWAALAVSVRKFLSGEMVEQCAQANRQLNRTTCCNDPDPCDVPFFLDLQFFARATGAFSFDIVKQQIDNGRPVAVRVVWNNGLGAHFVCVDGYNIAGRVPMVTVKDPWYGTSTIPYDVLVSSYQGIGTWTDSFRI